MNKLLKSSIAAVAVATSIFLIGCPAEKDTGSTATVKPAATHPVSTTSLQTGGQLRLPLTIGVDDPVVTNLDFSDSRLFALARCIGVPLVKSDSSGNLTPGLASSWQTTDDGSSWEFTLITAQEKQPDFFGTAFINHVKSVLRGEQGPVRGQLIDLLAGADEYAEGRTNELTGLNVTGDILTVSLTRPFALLPAWLSQPGLMVKPANNLVDSIGVPGSGLFVVTGVAGTEIQLESNPNSVFTGSVLDSVFFLCEPDQQRQLDLYMQQQLHSCQPPDAELAQLATDPEYSGQLVKVNTAAQYYGCFDLHEFPWSDSRFQSKLGLRQAVNLGLDRDYLSSMTNGTMTAWPHFFPETYKNSIPGSLLNKLTYPLTPRLHEAGEALKDADHWQGSHLIPGMDLAWLDYEPFIVLANNTLDFWEDISIKMRAMPDKQEVLYSRIETGKHEIILRLVRPAYPDPLALAYSLCHSHLSGTAGNWSSLNDPEVDRLVEETMAAVDPAVRVKLLQQLETYLEANALFVFMGYHSPSLLISPDLGGFKPGDYDFDGSLAGQDFSALGLLAD